MSTHYVGSSSGGLALELPLPDTLYRFDGQELEELPITDVVSSERFPVVGGAEYEEWVRNVVGLGTLAAAKPLRNIFRRLIFPPNGVLPLLL